MIRGRRVIPGLVLVAALVATFGCGGGKKTPAAGSETSSPQTSAAPAPKAAEKIAPYTYPAPVKGHFKEINTGDFDLVDGVASPSSATPGGTVVFVVAKPIASPVLAAAPCPLTAARSLTALRNAGWVEVTLDGKGRSKYFGYGTPFGGSGREADSSSHPWKSELRLSGGRAAGSVKHLREGDFRFDLPLSTPRGAETTETDWFEKRRGDAAASTPAADVLAAAYESLHKSAASKDLKAFLAAEGFDEKQVTAIRGLDAIDADFLGFTDRFLTPGEGGEGSRGPGFGSIRAEGVNSKGKKFANYYWFTSCGERLVLTRISENPQ